MWAMFSIMEYDATIDNSAQEFENRDEILKFMADYHSDYILVISTDKMLQYVGKDSKSIVILLYAAQVKT